MPKANAYRCEGDPRHQVKRLFIIVLLFARPACGQLIVTGGASSIYNADGGGISYMRGDTQTDIGLGLAQNKIVFGVDYRWKIRSGCTAVAGDFQEYLSVVGGGLAISNRGFALSCTLGKKWDFRVFVGADGEFHSLPFFTANSSTNHFGAGVEVKRNFSKDFWIEGLAAVAGSNRAYLEGAKYTRGGFTADEAGGLAQGRGYFQGDLGYQAHHFAVQATHADYIGLASYTSESASIGIGPVSAFASAFQARANSGQAVGAQIGGPITTNIYEMFSRGRKQTLIVESERYRHWTITQAISHAAGSTQVSFGGGYQGNTLSGSIGYQEVYNPLAGFQRAVAIQAGIQLPRFTLHLALDILPGGVIEYAGYGTAFVKGPPLASGQASQAAE
jgi:hypothetical protein